MRLITTHGRSSPYSRGTTLIIGRRFDPDHGQYFGGEQDIVNAVNDLAQVKKFQRNSDSSVFSFATRDILQCRNESR
jgi:hypothetical protein